MSKTKLYVAWLHSKYQYHNIFFFSSEKEELLTKILSALDTRGGAYGKNDGEYPGCLRLFMNRHRNEILGEKFFFRTLWDVEKNNIIEEPLAKEMFEMLDNNSKAFLYTEHENKYVKLYTEMVLRADWMNDVEIITNHIYLDPEDELKKIVV